MCAGCGIRVVGNDGGLMSVKIVVIFYSAAQTQGKRHPEDLQGKE